MDTEKLQEIIKNPFRAFTYALEFKIMGKYPESLEMCEWCFVNGNSNTPKKAGKKDLLILGQWADLAKDYPPANLRLIEIRDEEITKIKSGIWEYENFKICTRICFALKDRPSAIEIFREIDRQGCEKERMQKCFYDVFHLLIDNNEQDLCRKYLSLLDFVKYVKGCKADLLAACEASKKVNDLKEETRRLQEEIQMNGEEIPSWTIYASKLEKRVNYEEHKTKFIQRMKGLVKAFKFCNKEDQIPVLYEAGRGVIPEDEYQEIFK